MIDIVGMSSPNGKGLVNFEDEYQQNFQQMVNLVDVGQWNDQG